MATPNNLIDLSGDLESTVNDSVELVFQDIDRIKKMRFLMATQNNLRGDYEFVVKNLAFSGQGPLKHATLLNGFQPLDMSAAHGRLGP